MHMSCGAFFRDSIWTTYGVKWVSLHSKIRLHTSFCNSCWNHARLHVHILFYSSLLRVFACTFIWTAQTVQCFKPACTVALHHLKVADSWLQRHKQAIRYHYEDIGQMRTSDQIMRHHNSKFVAWFKDDIQNNPLPKNDDRKMTLFVLVHGPNYDVKTYEACDNNGYIFYNEDRDSKDTNSNNSIYSREGSTNIVT